MGSLSDQRGSWAGAVLLGGSYLLGRQINRGGMGEVFEATHARLPGRYAVKILRADLLGNREAFARFCREAEVMSELRHPNVVQIYDFNTTPDGRPYFVMEHLEGRDLERRLAESGPLPLPAAVRVVEAVASALATAHAHGIVHRDLKPSNIFLCTIDGQTDELVKGLDFGISKIQTSGTLLSSPTEMLGSPAYMSPEQARGGGEVDGRSDQFALGAIAYRMLTGWDPFTGDDIASLLYQVVHEDPPPLARTLPSFWDTRALQAVLDRALAKDPDQRFGGMMELARAFEAASEQTLSHDPAGSATVDLGSTLIATPPPPPLRPRQAVAPAPVAAPALAAAPAAPEIVDAPPPV
ncbi:MAG TPA: serine/threonine-protein kinase, partial [Polyangia bacterium]|nr:serine/threonine-protein kinase [Polyangia bacterium]